MKIDKNKTLVGGLLAVLLAASTSISGAAIIITDDFSVPVGPISAGGTLTPDYSAAGTKWSVESGAVSTNGTLVPGTDGQLGFDANDSSVIKINFGDVAENTQGYVEFGLRQWNGAAISDYNFSLTVGDSSTGQYYIVNMTLNPNYYGAIGGGLSGFLVVPSDGPIVASGTAGTYIDNTSIYFNYLRFSFDPTVGLTVLKNGNAAGFLGYVPAGMTKIDYVTLSNGDLYNGGRLGWVVDSFTVDAVLVPEPSTWMLLGLGVGAIVLLRRKKLVA